MAMKVSDLADLYEDTTRNMKKKLDSMIWKLDEFEKTIINTMKNVGNADSISVISLIQSVNSMREDYETLREEIAVVQLSYNEVRIAIEQEMNAILIEFSSLKNVVQNWNET